MSGIPRCLSPGALAQQQADIPKNNPKPKNCMQNTVLDSLSWAPAVRARLWWLCSRYRNRTDDHLPQSCFSTIPISASTQLFVHLKTRHPGTRHLLLLPVSHHPPSLVELTASTFLESISLRLHGFHPGLSYYHLFVDL